MRSAITLANVGLDAEVPDTSWPCPATSMTKLTPCAETSGNARPLVLKRPALVLPSCLRYPATASSWYDGRAKMLEKPPEENAAAVSSMPWVLPTEVRLEEKAR